jgi:hypothetical protein
MDFKKKHVCGECNFTTSRKFNLNRHYQRKHQNQTVHGRQAQVVYQQPIQQHPAGGQQVVHGARAQTFYHQPDQVPYQTSTFHGDELKSVEQKQQPLQHGQAQSREQLMCSICKVIVGTNMLEFQRHVKMFHPQKPIQVGAGKNRLAQQDLRPHGNSEETDSMETDSTEDDDADDDDDSPVVDAPDEEIDQIGSLIEEIHWKFDDTLRLRDEFREAITKLKDKNPEDLREVFTKYGDLHVAVLDERDGIDQEEEENGDEDEGDGDADEGDVGGSKKEENGDGDEGDGDAEEGDVGGSKKEGIYDYIFELGDVLDEEQTEIMEECVEKSKQNLIDSREEDSDDSDNELDTGTELEELEKRVKDVEQVIEGFKEEGGVYFQHCKASKIESVCHMCATLIENCNAIKQKYPNGYEKLKEMISDNADSIRKLADLKVTIHESKKTLQKTQVGEGILTPLRKLVIPFIKSMLRQRQF